MFNKGIYILLFCLLSATASAQLSTTGAPSRVERDDQNIDPFANTDDSPRSAQENSPDGTTEHPLGLLPNPTFRKDTRYTYEDLIWRTIDTSILNFHVYDLVNQWQYPAENLGIIGQNYTSLVYNPNRKIGFVSGFNNNEKYWYTAQNARYYNTKVPFTSVYYNLGAKVENNANVIHSQNIGPHYNFAVDYRLSNKVGAYTRQKTLMHNLNMNNWYNSKNHRYTLFFSFLFNRQKLEENGGVAIEDLFSKANASIARELIPINLSGAENDTKNRGVHAKQIFFIGKKDSVQINDSTNLAIVQRKHALSYSFNYDNWKYKYNDAQNSNSTYYTGFNFDSTATADSSRFWSTQHNFRFENSPISFKTDSAQAVNKLRYYVGLDYDYSRLINMDTRKSAHNLGLTGGLSSNPLLNQKWQYSLSGKILISPKNFGDFKVNAFLVWKINEMMHLRAIVESKKSSPTLKETRYRSNHFIWENNFAAIYEQKISLLFRCDHGDIDGELTWHNVQNYTYLDENITYQQSNKNLNVLVFRASKAFDWKNFYLYNGITAQYVSDRNKINLPTFIMKQSFHYKGGFIKGKLTAHLGFDINYHTNYMGDAYNPALQLFHRQQNQTLKFYPVIDTYFELFVKRARIFFLMEHINQGMFKQKGYFIAPGYGAEDRQLKVGVSWQFYD